MTRCHLDEARVCGRFCIAFDHQFGCRLKANNYAAPTRNIIQGESEETLNLKEI